MSDKYDFQIERIDPNTAHGKVLMRVKPGSTVLECGCATGYMTRYMTEKLNCQVDIVEKDNEAFLKARPAARDGFCGDLAGAAWYYYYKEKRYDYILFADVLEHLIEPREAVRKAIRLLKDDGKIIISIPNICHNDIILNLYDNQFMYTQYGILDNTHVHFWGLKDFEWFCHFEGLKITDRDTVFVSTGCTEQRPLLNAFPPELVQVLKKRPDGEVFQYVFVCEKR